MTMWDKYSLANSTCVWHNLKNDYILPIMYDKVMH